MLFWFVLLVLALFNATLREATYKPLLVPHIGIWAHQISSLTGIGLFVGAIYFFIKHIQTKYTDKHWLMVGIIWIVMTLLFETWMNMGIRKLSFTQVLETYYFWKGETWVFVILSLLILPPIINRVLNPKLPTK